MNFKQTALWLLAAFATINILFSVPYFITGQYLLAADQLVEAFILACLYYCVKQIKEVNHESQNTNSS